MSEQNKTTKHLTRALSGVAGVIGLAVTMTLAASTPASALLDGGGGNTGPSQSNFGTANIAKFTNGLEFYALLACLAAIFISAILWAVGSKGQNPGQELTGKRGLILAVTAAFFIGAIPGIMGFLNTQAKDADRGVGVTTAGAPGSSSPAANCTTFASHQGTCP